MRSSAAALGLFLAAALALGGRAGAADKPAPAVLGAVYNLSGSQAELDIPSFRGARLAVEEANRAGGVLGLRIDLVVADGESRAETVRARTAELLEENPSIIALMGLSDTDMVLAAAPVAAKARRLFLTSGATSPRLPAQVPDYLFLACFGDNVQAAAAAEWIYRDRGARSAAVLFNATMSYARLLHGYFEARFTALGGTVLSVESYAPDAIGPAVRRLKPADVVFVAAGPQDAPEAARLLRKAGVTAPILGGDGFDTGEQWLRYPDVSEVYFTTHAYLDADDADPAARAFRKAYGDAYGGDAPNAFAALGYDAARLLIRAIESAASTDPDKVRAALARTREFDGVTGSIGYPGGARIPAKSVSVVAIDGGKRRFVTSLVPAVIPPP